MKNRKIPFGYEMQKGKIKISEYEAEILHRIFAEYINGRNLKELAEMLTEQNIEYLPGMSAWNKNRIKRILEDKRYTGDDKYPMIINNQIFTQANTIKAERRTNENCIVNAKNKLIIYTTKCACCGGTMIHKVDKRSKCVEQWLCDNTDCRTRINMTINELKSAITALMNMCINDPSITDKDEDEQELSAEIRLMENDIDRMTEQADIDKSEILNRILECAAKKYEQIKSKAHITQRLKAEFEKSSLLSGFYTDLFEKTVSAIRMNIDGEISLVLKNGKLIEKGETNGNDHSNDTA